MYKNTIYDMTENHLAKQLIGRTITKIDVKRKQITLDNGRTLTFVNTSDCCAWFQAELEEGNLTDNAITALKVTEHEEEEDEEGVDDYTIHILAANEKIADLHIAGDHGSGYYCHSIDLIIEAGSNA